MTAKTYQVEGIILKRSNLGEADLLVTLFSKETGKLTAIAKGARRITSSKASALEPATVGKYFFAVGKSLDILTQAQLLKSHQGAHRNLTRTTQTFQVLEIVDLLTAERQENSDVYLLLAGSLDLLESTGSHKDQLLNNLNRILQALGFADAVSLSESKLKAYIEDLSNQRLRSKNYLQPH